MKYIVIKCNIPQKYFHKIINIHKAKYVNIAEVQKEFRNYDYNYFTLIIFINDKLINIFINDVTLCEYFK